MKVLFIGDIHINTRYKDQIIDQVKAYIQKYPEEKHIIFLGDYVYHFSYDRNALLALYDLFIDLYLQEKYVYVLAGNHDWIGNSFVFEEAQKAFGLLNDKLGMTHDKGLGFLKFITKPIVEEIENEQILFLPYIMHTQNVEQEEGESRELEWKFIDELLVSENKHQQISGYINHVLYEYTQKYKKLTVVHHYYTNNTVFPGQRSRFAFKDVALSEKFLDLPNIKMISGHLHQPFVHKNYLCTGSVWSTSPLEINQIKGCFCYDVEQNKMKMGMIAINPYLYIETDVNDQEGEGHNPLTKSVLEEKFQDMIKQAEESLQASGVWDVEVIHTSKLDMSKISLQMKVEKIDYEHIDEYVEDDLVKILKDVKLKKPTTSVKDLLKDFEVSTQNLSTGFADRKDILKSYLEKKYPDDHEKYKQMLRELKLF